MAYSEKSFQYSNGRKSFPFATVEQEFFAINGFTNEPRRCPSCRSAKKTECNGNFGGSYIDGSPR